MQISILGFYFHHKSSQISTELNEFSSLRDASILENRRAYVNNNEQ